MVTHCKPFLQICCIFCISFNLCADDTQNVKDAFAAYKAQRWEEAAHLLKPLADKGDADACAIMGQLSAEGLGVKKNLPSALHYYQKATSKDHDGIVAYQIGYIYALGGEGVAKNPEEAMRWYKISAKKNNPAAQSSLANFYLEGVAVAKNEKLAAELYRKAALQEFKIAQYNLGIMYLKGLGVPQSKVLAIKWLSRAANNDHPEAKKVLAKITETP